MTGTVGDGLLDITTMDAICCRNCQQLSFLKADPTQVPDRQFWTANMVVAVGCAGPIAVETGSLKTSGLDFPHYCAMFGPAKRAG